MTTTKNAKLREIAEYVLAEVESEHLTDAANLIGLKGWDHSDSKVEDAAASVNYWLEGLRNALTTIVESAK